MIPNITKGDRPVGLMKYLVGPGKRNEHTDPHLVTGSPTIMAWFDDVQLDESSAVMVAKELDLNRRTFDMEVPNHVWHCSLSLRVDERPVTEQQWADIAQDFMDELGFTETSGNAPVQWVAVHHGTSIAGNDHIHVVASRVRADGTKWHDGADYPKVQRAARGIEKKYGLMELGQYAERGFKPAEQRAGQGQEPARFRMERLVRSSAVASQHEAEFVRRLRRSGLLVSARFADGGRSVVTGYAVAERPPKGMRPIWFGGGKLAKDLTLPALRTGWPDTPQQAQEAAEEWWAAKRHHRIVNPDAPDMKQGSPVTSVAGRAFDEDLARKFALELAEARRAMTKVAPGDHQTWAHVARETSGLLGAWSRATESTPGPLAEASRAMARSAHRSGLKITEAVDPPLRMAGTTAFLLAATSAPSPVAQALIMQQMLRTFGAVRAMHEAETELREANVLTQTIRNQLVAVAGPLPDVPEPKLQPAHDGPNRQVKALTEVDGYAARERQFEQHTTHDQGMGR